MKTFQIYYTSDMHGYMFPTNYYSKEEKPMGLINALTDFSKDKNTLILDGGDNLQGSPLAAYINTSYTDYTKDPLAEVLNTADYDAVTLGNHDFNFGYSRLDKYLNSLKCLCICANVNDTKGKLNILPYKIFTLENGIKIGITGIVTDYVNVWEQSDTIKYLQVTDAYTAAKSTLQTMKKLSDITVCIYHGGFEGNADTGEIVTNDNENIGLKICKELDFNILLTAHQHMLITGRYINGTYTLQLPANVVKYAKITYDGSSFSSEILQVSENSSKEIYNKLLPLQNKVQDWLDISIGTLDKEIPELDKLTMALGNADTAALFNQIQLEYSKADISCVGLGNNPMGINKYVTIRELMRVYPFLNTLKTILVTEKILIKALERCAEYFEIKDKRLTISDKFLIPKIEHYNYDFFAGISYEFDISKPAGQRVTKLLYKGKPIGNKTLKLALSDYRASGTGGYDFYKDCPVLEKSDMEIQQMAIEYFRKNKNVFITEKTDINVIF